MDVARGWLDGGIERKLGIFRRSRPSSLVVSIGDGTDPSQMIKKERTAGVNGNGRVQRRERALRLLAQGGRGWQRETNTSGILRDEGGGGRRREAKVGFLLRLEAGVTNEIGARGSRATLFDEGVGKILLCYILKKKRIKVSLKTINNIHWRTDSCGRKERRVSCRDHRSCRATLPDLQDFFVIIIPWSQEMLGYLE